MMMMFSQCNFECHLWPWIASIVMTLMGLTVIYLLLVRGDS